MKLNESQEKSNDLFLVHPSGHRIAGMQQAATGCWFWESLVDLRREIT